MGPFLERASKPIRELLVIPTTVKLLFHRWAYNACQIGLPFLVGLLLIFLMTKVWVIGLVRFLIAITKKELIRVTCAVHSPSLKGAKAVTQERQNPGLINEAVIDHGATLLSGSLPSRLPHVTHTQTTFSYSPGPRSSTTYSGLGHLTSVKKCFRGLPICQSDGGIFQLIFPLLSQQWIMSRWQKTNQDRYLEQYDLIP